MSAVARSGDVVATASTTGKYTGANGAATGTWVAGPVNETLLDAAGSDGARLVTSATCTFSFSGKLDADTATVVQGTSDVSLEPGGRTLVVGGKHPLVDGDQASDINQNRLAVSSTATWITS